MDAESAPARSRTPLTGKGTRPTPAYRRRVWTAVAGLVLFVGLYLWLAVWFLRTAYLLTLGAEEAHVWGWVAGLSSLLLGVFMLKALVFLRRGAPVDGLEVTARDHPRLFTFLHEIADGVGAPRPHRVLITGEVNAGVFYDLSLLNLVVPTRKNLAVGLGLVNALNLGEVRAVIAHEFGHFAQRSMAVGRWVYVASQVAAHVVGRRDRLDAFLDVLSRFDLRVAWIGWTLRLIVWSIRSLVDTAFRQLMRLQRALEREMEFDADLVAVSLTGSDALIHALHKLQAADDSWERTTAHVTTEVAHGRLPADMFALHSRVLSRMREVIDDPSYGVAPPLPAEGAERHRVFAGDTVQPPRMWLSHPPNHEREENAKRDYVAMPIDETSAWTLFDDPEALRAKVTARLIVLPEPRPVPSDEPLRALDAKFSRPLLDRRFRGLYLGRSVVRGSASIDGLLEPLPADWRAALDATYPEPLTEVVARWRELTLERERLREIQAGSLQPTDGILRHRGRVIARDALPRAIADVTAECGEVEERLAAADRDVRTAHLAAATAIGDGWPAYLRGLVAVLHYAEHTSACIRELGQALHAVVARETVTGRVRAAGRVRIFQATRRLHDALASASRRAPAVELDAALRERLGVASWAAAFEAYSLPPADEGNLGSWLEVIAGWVRATVRAHGRLADHALDLLLQAEDLVAAHARAGTSPGPAPEPPAVPPRYETSLPHEARTETASLDWWERFQVASGRGPAAARFAVAAGIVVAVLGFGSVLGEAVIAIQNGLDVAVVVRLDDHAVMLDPRESRVEHVSPGPMRISTSTVTGQPVESFDVVVRGRFSRHAYNVASAAPLVEWTATYGAALPRPARPLGAPRWLRTEAEHLFTDPPEEMSVGRTGARLLVLATLSDVHPHLQVGNLPEQEVPRVARAHARFDRTDGLRFTAWWPVLVATDTAFAEVLADRLTQAPDDVVLLRLQQDHAPPGEREAVCARRRERAAASPDDADRAYLAARCIDGPAGAEAMRAGHVRWPDHPWFGNAVAYDLAGRAEWSRALALWQRAYRRAPAFTEQAATEMARVTRLLAALDSGGARPPQPKVLGLERPDAPEALAQYSLALQHELSLQDPASPDTTVEEAALLALHRGDHARAWYFVRGDSGAEARLARLIAASDGADGAAVDRAFRLPPEAGLDLSTYWLSVALGLRAGRAPRVPPDSAWMNDEVMRQVRRFLGHAQRRDLAAAERELAGLAPSWRGYAYAAGVVLLGREAPASWRVAAKALLFMRERPYLR